MLPECKFILFSQFVAHDMIRTMTHEDVETMVIPVLPGDSSFVDTNITVKRMK